MAPDPIRITPQELRREAAEGARKAKLKTADNGKDHEPRQFPRFWLDDATSDIDAPYAVKGLIEPGRLALIYGPSGDGKTFLAIDLACHIASGMSWRGMRVRRCLVAYVAAEAGAGIARRFFAWREERLGLHEGRVPLVVITRGANLLDEVEVAELIGTLKAIATEANMPMGLVFIDTLSRSIPGGLENAAEDMSKAIGVADRIRDELAAGTVFVHHTGKDTAKGARGHTSLPGAADTVISVIERTAMVEKVRDGHTQAQFPFELDVIEIGVDQDGDTVTTCVVRHLDAARSGAAVMPKLTNNEKVALDVLQQVVSASGTELPDTSVMPRTRGARLDQWREGYYLRSGEQVDRQNGAEVKAFKRARDGLLAKKLIGASTPWVWVW